MRLLFVCSQNLLRSPTAEAVFAEYDEVEALSAGTAPDAATPLSADLIERAEIIFAMEDRHRDALPRKFSAALRSKKSSSSAYRIYTATWIRAWFLC